MEPNDCELVRQCLAGRQDACARLVDAYSRMVGTVIWRATGDRVAVEDLSQETFLRVFRALSYFDAQARLSTWIYTIAHRVSIDHLRKTGRCREESLAPGSDFRSPAIGPEGIFEREEIGNRVRHALAQLPDKYRLALVYAAIDGLDYPTVAAMLDVPLGTVKTLIFRGKRMLKEKVLDAM